MDTKEIENFIKEHTEEFLKLADNQQELFHKIIASEDWNDELTYCRELIKLAEFPRLNDYNADLNGKNLNDQQKAIALLLYHAEVDPKHLFYLGKEYDSDYNIFPSARSILRWIGVEQQGVLEEIIDFQYKGQTIQVPLWRAFQLDEDESDYENILNQLSVEMQMKVAIELIDFFYSHDTFSMYGVYPDFLLRKELFEKIGNDYGDWAASHITMLLEKDERSTREREQFIFHCLTKAGVQIKPEWLKFIPEYSVEDFIDYFPDEQKESVIKSVLPKFTFSDFIVKNAIKFFDLYPCQALIDAIAEHYDKCRKPARIILKTAIDAVEAGSEWQIKLKEILNKLPKIQELFVLSNLKPETQEAVPAVHADQLALAMKKWDGEELSLEERFAHEDEEMRLPDNLDEILVLCDNKGTPVADIVCVGCDSASIFEPGTLTELGSIVQGSIKMRKRKLKEAINYAMFARDEFQN